MGSNPIFPIMAYVAFRLASSVLGGAAPHVETVDAGFLTSDPAKFALGTVAGAPDGINAVIALAGLALVLWIVWALAQIVRGV